jgi:hypothetical protein
MLLGLGGMFWLTAAFAIVGMGLVLTVPRPAPSRAEPGDAADFSRAPILLLSFSVFLLHAVLTLLFVAFPPMLIENFGIALADHWSLYLPSMVVSVLIVVPMLRRVGASLSERRVLPWAFFALAAALALLPFGLRWAGLAALITLYFVGFNLLEAAMPSLLSRITGSRGRGQRLGVYSTFQFLGAFVGGVAGGWLLGGYGSAPALITAGVVCLAWGTVLMFAGPRVFLTRAAG